MDASLHSVRSLVSRRGAFEPDATHTIVKAVQVALEGLAPAIEYTSTTASEISRRYNHKQYWSLA